MPKTTEINDSEWEGGTPTREIGVNFSKEGDWFKGTLTGSKEVEGMYGLTKVWSAVGVAGTFHKEDGSEQVNVIPGVFYYIWNKPVFSDDMSKVAIGQRFGIRFKGMSEKPSQNTKKHYKVFEVKLFEMDNEWLANNKQASAVSEPPFNLDDVPFT